MQLNLNDRLPLSGIKRDSAGNLVAVAKAARTGIQVYAGYEVGRPDLPMVNVYRPAEEVFHRDSMRTYAGAPVTIEHPKEPVTPENWKDTAVGETASDDIVRDGETVKVPFLVRDAAGQQAIEDGKHEISMGYACMLDFTPGVVPDGQPDAGTAYDAVQRTIRINHLAIVDKARGGPELRIGDNNPGVNPMNLVPYTVDGITLQVNPEAKQLLDKQAGVIATHAATLADRDASIATLTTERDTLKGEKVALEQKVKDAEAASSPEKLAALATARAGLIADAKRLAPKLDVDGKTDAEIRRAAVAAKIGDAAVKDLNDAEVTGAFVALVPAASNKGTQTGDAITGVVNEGISDGVTDLQDSRDKAKAARLNRFSNFGQEAEASA